MLRRREGEEREAGRVEDEDGGEGSGGRKGGRLEGESGYQWKNTQFYKFNNYKD